MNNNSYYNKEKSYNNIEGKSNNLNNTNNFSERKVFTNSQPRKLEDLKYDSNISNLPPKLENKSEISKQLNVVGELLKQTSLENEKFNPPKNLYMDKDLDIRYSNSFNSNKNYKNNSNSHQNYKNKKYENSNTASTNTNNSKYDDLQKPVFVNKKSEGTSNFVEIKNDGDVIIYYKNI